MQDGYYSAQEIVDLKLPGMPSSAQGVQKMAKREGWLEQDRYNRWQPVNDPYGTPLSRKRSGRGGGYEFHYMLFPQDAWESLVNKETKKTVQSKEIARTVETQFKNPDQYNSLNDWQREVIESRCSILNWLDEHRLKYGSKEAAIDELLIKCKAQTLPIYLRDLIIKANAKSGLQTNKPKLKISKSTIKNWYRYRELEGVVGLAPGIANKTDFSIPDWGWTFLDLYRRPNKPSLTAVIDELPDHLPAELKAPSYDQAKRFLKKLSPVALNKGRMGPQALKSMKAFTRRGTEDLWPGAVFSADGHTFKAKIEHPYHGQPFRPEITAVIDIYTRYITGWSVGLAENSIGVLQALSSSIIECDDGRHRALPAIWYTDNGSGFRAKMFEDAGTGFYDRWGITAKNSLPYNSQARGVIERLNRTTWSAMAKQFETYVGGDADKEAMREIQRISDIELRAKRKAPFLLTWDEFKQCVQQFIDAYNNKPHSSLPRTRCPISKRNRHMSPKDLWDKWIADGGESKLIAKEDADDLTRPYERRKVSRGEVRILNNYYFSFDLERYHGDEVMVGYDIFDASKVWVRNFDGRLLAIAQLDGNKVDYFNDGELRMALSAQDQSDARRTKGRLNLVEKKREEILEEAAGTPLEIEYQVMEQAPALTQYDHQIADEAFAKLEKRNEPKAEREIIPGKRPIFSDEVQLARWLIQNPDQVTEKDARLFKEKLRGKHFRQLLEFEDVLPDTLEAIIAQRAVSNT
jgi:putative transposase